MAPKRNGLPRYLRYLARLNNSGGKLLGPGRCSEVFRQAHANCRKYWLTNARIPPFDAPLRRPPVLHNSAKYTQAHQIVSAFMPFATVEGQCLVNPPPPRNLELITPDFYECLACGATFVGVSCPGRVLWASLLKEMGPPALPPLRRWCRGRRRTPRIRRRGLGPAQGASRPPCSTPPLFRLPPDCTGWPLARACVCIRVCARACVRPKGRVHSSVRPLWHHGC